MHVTVTKLQLDLYPRRQSSHSTFVRPTATQISILLIVTDIWEISLLRHVKAAVGTDNWLSYLASS